MLSQEELAAMMTVEEKRLGVGSEEFIQHHNEIMRMIDEARKNGGKTGGTDCTDGNAERGIPKDRDKLRLPEEDVHQSPDCAYQGREQVSA